MLLPIPRTGASAPPTAPAIINDGINTFGSLAANGIAPSVIPKNPIIPADVAFTVSFSSHDAMLKNLATPAVNASTIGGTETATAAAPFTIGLYRSPVKNNTAVAIAILFTGPPRSNEIIAPMNIPANHSRPAFTRPSIASCNPYAR